MLVIEYSLNIRNLLCNPIVQYPIYFTRITNMSEIEHIFKAKERNPIYLFLSLFLHLMFLMTIIHNMTKFHDDRFFSRRFFFRFVLFFRPGIFYQTKKRKKNYLSILTKKKELNIFCMSTAGWTNTYLHLLFLCRQFNQRRISSVVHMKCSSSSF